MNILQKFYQQDQFKGILLFKEGMFLRAYNQGAFLLTEHLGCCLNLRFMQFKKYPNRQIVVCGFPESKLTERLPKAVKTVFGAELRMDYDTEQYHQWLKRRWHEERVANEMSKADIEPLKTSKASASEPADIDKKLYKIELKLSKQQLIYLKYWQSDSHIIDTDKEFIKNIKKQLFKT